MDKSNQSVDGADHPSWLHGDCPHWCVVHHRESDLPDDRFHMGDPVSFPVLKPPPAIALLLDGVVGFGWLNLYLIQLLRDSVPRIWVGVADTSQGFTISTAEAEDLSDMLRQLVSEV